MTTQTAVKAKDNGAVSASADKPKVNRRSFTERLSDLSLEEKVAVIKELKGQVAEELARREQSAKEAASLAQGL